MKQKYLLKIFFVLLFLATAVKAQSAGDLAFIAYNADGDKDFSIVVLADISANSTIYFTDDETTGVGSPSALAGSEGTIIWSTGNSIVKAGTVVVFTDPDDETNPGFGASVGTITESGSFSISGSKDGLIAFVGSDENTPTTYISAIQIGNDSSTLGPFDGDGITLTNTGLVIGSTIVVIDNVASPDGGKYTGSRSNQTNYSDYRTLLTDESTNWTTVSSSGDGETLLPYSTESFTINTTNWTGTTSNVWNLAGNWDNGIPTSSSLVTIPEVTNAPEIATGTSAEVGNISITEADGLSIFGGNLTVHGNITVNTGSSLYLESTFTGASTVDAATLILKGSYTSADADKFFYFTETFNDNTSGWTLISSPTVGETIDGGATGFATFNALQTSASNNYGIAIYDNSLPFVSSTSPNRWDYYTTTEIAATNNITMTSGKGYSVLPDSGLNADTANGNLGFKGAVPTSDISIAITDNSGGVGTAFNLVGNPYPTFIPADNAADATNSFLNINTSVLSENTLWFWDKATSAYITVNQLSNRLIAPGQGFFVSSGTGGGTVKFTEAMQSHQSSGIFNRNANLIPEITLNVSDNETSKSTSVFYYEGKTTDFDNGYDSSIFNGVSNSFSIYTKFVSGNDDKKLAIQTLPNSDYENMIIPIGIKASAGNELTFTAETQNLPSNLKVFIEDKETNTFVRLDEANADYKLTLTQDLDGTGRFYLHTTPSVLKVNTENLNAISIYKSSASTLKIIGLPQGNTNVKLFNILGKQVMNTSFTSNGVKDISLPKLATGLYIVQLDTKEGKLTKKIILE